jgi:hypothetical protein
MSEPIIEVTKEMFEHALGHKMSDEEWTHIINRNRDDYFPSAEVAIPEYFEPQVPCRQFETRSCVDLSLDDTKRHRRAICPAGKCTRFPD